MEVMIAALAFVVSHVAIVRTRIKPLIQRAIGERAYLLGYSLLSLALLGWLISAIVRSSKASLWTVPVWSYPFAVLVSALAFAFIGIGCWVRNPLSVSFRSHGFDPERPGVIGWVRHPLILGFGLWGAAHTPSNGQWPDIVLFAGTMLFAAVGIVAIDSRRRRELGEQQWEHLRRGEGSIDWETVLGALLGLMAWAVLLNAHSALFGVDPWATTWRLFAL